MNGVLRILLLSCAALLIAPSRAAAQPLLPRVPSERLIVLRCPDGPPPLHELPPDTLTEDDFALVVCKGGWHPVLNANELARTMARGYPPLLRDAGVGGRTEVQFAVGPDGTVDSATVRVTRTSHRDFAALAMRVIRTMRLDMREVNEAAGGRPFRRIWLLQPVDFRLAA